MHLRCSSCSYTRGTEPTEDSRHGQVVEVSTATNDPRPLVVTLLLDSPAQERFEAQRAELFPRGRTAVGAHVTLFHALPGPLRRDVEDELARLTADTPPFPVGVTEVFPLGRGVAYRLVAPAAELVHRRLADRWRPHLTRQDAQPFRPHVTVQNKVEPDVANVLRQGCRVP